MEDTKGNARRTGNKVHRWRMCAGASESFVLSAEEMSAASIGGGHVQDTDDSDVRMSVVAGAGTPSITMAYWCSGRRSRVAVGKKLV